MQRLFVLIIGITLGGIITAILIPMFFDYSNRIEVSQLLNEIKPLQQQIENELHKNIFRPQIIKNKKEYHELLKNKHIDYLNVFEGGEIFIKKSPGGEMLLMIPRYSSGTIAWQCLGGSNKDVPVRCWK